MKHTPGPWIDDIEVDEVHCEGLFEITNMDHSETIGYGTTEANAHLIASAPDLLGACQMMLRLIEGENLDEKFDGEAEILREAISQAEGK